VAADGSPVIEPASPSIEPASPVIEPVEIILLRHGRTAWNDEGRAQGQTDVELDPTGHAQAEAAARVLAERAPSRLVSSDLARALQTAAYLERATGLPAEHDPRLREIHWGVREGLTLAEFQAAHPGEYAGWEASGRVAAIEGGESEEQVADRVGRAVAELLADARPGERIVVVSHGGALKSAVAALLGWPGVEPSRLRAMDNCAWASIERRGDRTTLVAYNRAAPPISHP